jgi:NAD(P)-dependent dehydrogenase (short-subunit alcohol dehydrogenase family)
MAVNLTGVWLCVQQEIRYMLANGGGAIVNTASIAGLRGFPLIPAYSASKHGVIGITKSAAKGYGKDGIRVNAVCPGVIETPLVAPLIDDPSVSEPLVALHPPGRFGRPAEVGEVVAWWCSDAASFVTGIAMPVDAGYTA